MFFVWSSKSWTYSIDHQVQQKPVCSCNGIIRTKKRFLSEKESNFFFFLKWWFTSTCCFCWVFLNQASSWPMSSTLFCLFSSSLFFETSSVTLPFTYFTKLPLPFKGTFPFKSPLMDFLAAPLPFRRTLPLPLITAFSRSSTATLSSLEALIRSGRVWLCLKRFLGRKIPGIETERVVVEWKLMFGKRRDEGEEEEEIAIERWFCRLQTCAEGKKRKTKQREWGLEAVEEEEAEEWQQV